MAKGATAENPLKRHERVVANVDLDGIPAGTGGRITLANGLTWHRYRVLFDNGEDRGHLDNRHLVRPKEFVPLDERVEEEPTAATAAAGADEPEAAPADASGDRGGVPAHLLERSKKARERLTASA
jgi:hypothetical protein